MKGSGDSMYARSITGALIAVVTAAGIGLATAPALAQDQPATRTTTIKKRPTQVAVVGPPAARVTVRKRSYLDPGTETKTHAEHNLDYAFPTTESRNGMDRFLNDYNITFTRNPIPGCLDLAGFCR
jgi:hypothetical protein